MRHIPEPGTSQACPRAKGPLNPDRLPTVRLVPRLGLLLFILACCVSAGVAAAQSFQADKLQPAAVTVDYFDARGLILRSTNGVILKEGLLVPYSALGQTAKVGVRSWDGSTWSSDRLIALHPDVDLALLQLDDIPSYAIRLPQDASFVPNGDVTMLRGPEGDSPAIVTATLFGKFAMRGPDFLAVSAGLPAAAPAFKPDGNLVGICFDLSEKGFSLSYLVSSASISNIVSSRGTPVSLASLVPPMPPTFTTSAEPEGLVFRGALLHTTGKTEDARSFINLALKKEPGYPDALFWTGKILFGESNYQDAAEAFAKAGESDKGFHMAWHMAGAARNQAAQYHRAIEMYEKALEADPESAFTYCNLGGAYHNLYQREKAIGAFNKSIELDPTYGLAYFNLSMLYKQTGKPEKAEEVYKRLKQKNPSWASRLRSQLDK